jgi:hypothetical protein
MNSGVNEKLIFLHIPKTAGSTLRKVITQQYAADETLKCYYQKRGILLREALAEMKAIPKEQAARIKIVLGHIGFGVHDHLPWPCSYITMLRDPIDRVISGYYHILRDGSHKFQAEVQRMSLKEYVSSDLLRSEAARVNAVNAMDNGQTRLLAGNVVEAEMSGAPVEYGRCEEGMLERAKKNLKEHFKVVGLSERFDESLMLMKRVLGWSSIYYVKANVGWNRTRKEEIGRETLRSIEKYNELDIELYRFASEMFDEAISSQGPLFKRRIDSYRLLNKTYGEARRLVWAIEKRISQKAAGERQ